ncbi:MAG: energy transducer TonB [Rikenellaceae bacterium]
MHYYNPENKAPQRWAALAVVAYLLVLLLLMIFISFSTSEEDPLTEGILVQFGETDFGQGEDELVATDVAATPPPPQTQDAEEQILTDERSDIDIEQPEVKTPEKQQTPQIEQPVQQRDTVIVEERVVNKQALFPGRSTQSTSTSQGDGEESGNQGAANGGAEGGAVGGGEDGDLPVAVLKDRSVVGVLPKPAYRANVSGRVIIDITVDDSGRVKSATYRAQGSTTNNSQLVSAAQEAALKARFTPSDNFIQGGTITYVFKMN